MAAINIWNNLLFGNLPKAEALANNIFYTIQSNKFWKKLDASALQFYREFVVKGSEKVTRELTRGLIKFVNEKNLSNKTTVNHINDIWEDIHREYDTLDVNKLLQDQLDIIFPPKTPDVMSLDQMYQRRQSQYDVGHESNTTHRYCSLMFVCFTILYSPGRIQFSDLKQLPGSRPLLELVTSLTQGQCGAGLVSEALREVGDIIRWIGTSLKYCKM